jgi:Na+-translocating ferredoxin:NAD+ oxidoreductase RnfC subunit
MYDGLMFEVTTHSRAGTKQTSGINVLSAAMLLLHTNTVQCLMCPGCGTACKLPHCTVSNSWK